MSHKDPNSENAPHWNPVDYPVDGLEPYEDDEEEYESSADEVFEDEEEDEAERD